MAHSSSTVMRYLSSVDNKTMQDRGRPKPPTFMIFVNYFSRLILILFGLLSELFGVQRVKQIMFNERDRDSYPRLYDRFFSFYYRNIVSRLWDILSFPLCSVAAEKITILERESRNKFTGRKLEALNFGSYNYLGYSQNTGHIADSVEHVIKEYGVGVCSSAVELGRHQIYCELETLVAKYLGTEDAICFGMGFATNAYTMSALFGKGCLVLSDELNHASIILGCRLTGASIKVFKHNDMRDLEQLVRNSIVKGQPKTGRDWRKIIVIMEGIYSMEGTIGNLPELIRIKKKYKLYLYLDEAHSIGAIGKTGRGICEYFGCNPRDVDILMGTFTKSFAAAGGYIAGDHRIIQYMRCRSASFHFGQPMAPPIVQQIKAVFTDLSDNQSDSEWRIRQLNRNVTYFRQQLINRGYHIDGNTDSPVVPLMVYSEAYMRCFLLKLLNSGIATVGVGYPVTTLLGVRIRLCVSAAHTQQMIDYAINTIDKIGSELSLNFSKN